MSDDRPEPLEFQPDGVADELVERDQWLVWQYDWLVEREEWSKVPKNGSGGDYRIDATDPENGVAFDVAVETYESGDYDGLGFITDADGLLVGFDWDDCRDPDQPHGSVPDAVHDAIDELETYTELSPSGTGYRQFAFGTRPDGGTRADLPCDPVLDDVPHVEIYDGTGGRYLTVTGQHVEGTPEDVAKRPQETNAIHRRFIADDESDDVERDDQGGEATEPTDLDDQQLVEKAKNASNGDKFARLWNGNTSGYESHSEADAALCSLLAFWTGEDAGQMDRLFRDSGLMRSKWDEDRGSQTYGERTIQSAIGNNSDVYEPGSGGSSPEPPTPQIDQATDGGERDFLLRPREFKAEAGLDEDDSIGDLNDRQKAAYIWSLVSRCDSVHVRVNRENDELWAFDPDTGTWNPDGERALRHAARRTIGRVNYGGNVLEELKNQVRADPAAEVWGDQFGLEAGTVAVKNGLLDLSKAAADEPDAVRDLKPRDYAMTRLPVEYDPDASGEWGSFVTDVVEDGMIDAVQEYIGYCLHRDSTFDRSLLLVGGGANGKSTFLNVVEELLGDDNTTNVSPYDFGDKPSMAQLHGALANISADLAGGSLQGKNLGNFKKLTGGDTVTAKRLYKDPFKFTYDGGMLFAANEVPDVPVSDDDAAFWRRWIIVHFDNYFPEGSDKRDPQLEGRLKEPENLSALLNWAIDGWARLMDQGEFTGVPGTPDETRRKWQKWGDSVDEFLSDVATRNAKSENISTNEAHQVYLAWCDENDREAVGQYQFTMSARRDDPSLGYTERLRTDRSAVPVRGYACFDTTDEFADPIDVIGDDQNDDSDDEDSDGDGTRNTGLDSFEDADRDDESDDVERDDQDDDHDRDERQDADDQADEQLGDDEPLGPVLVQYVRENQDGREGVPHDELVEHVVERGVSQEYAEGWIDKCLRRGDLAEPAADVYHT